MNEIVYILIGAIVLGYAGTFMYVLFRIHFGLRHSSSVDAEAIQAFGKKVEEVPLQTRDKVDFEGWYIQAKKPKAAIVLVHGFTLDSKTGGVTTMIPHAQFLVESGYSVLIINLRSFTGSRHKKVYLGTREWREVQSGYEFLKEQESLKHKKIGLYGVSMGAASVLVASGSLRIGDFVIATVPFLNPVSLIIHYAKFKRIKKFFFKPLVRLALVIELGIGYGKNTPGTVAKQIQAPVFITGARKDYIVNTQDAIQIYQDIESEKEIWLADATHDTLGDQPHELKSRVLKFIHYKV
ncbi:MAG: alpha/beta hydrolase [Candidatus Dojkabacteria bacterium]